MLLIHWPALKDCKEILMFESGTKQVAKENYASLKSVIKINYG